jgi:hypothetical protein
MNGPPVDVSIGVTVCAQLLVNVIWWLRLLSWVGVATADETAARATKTMESCMLR